MGEGRRRKNALVTLLVLTVATLLPHTGLGADAVLKTLNRDWQKLETPRFTVYSRLGAKETAAWAEDYECFIASLRRIIQINEIRLAPLTIVLMDGESEFDPFRPKGIQAAGYFSRFESSAVMGMYQQFEDERTAVVIHHEGVHWLLSADTSPRPPALEEGLASVFETYHREGKTVLFGKANVGRLLSNEPGAFTSVEQLLSLRLTDPAVGPHGIGPFYSRSWLLMHYILYGDKSGGAQAANEMLRAFGAGLPPHEALVKALGREGAERIDARLSSYSHSGIFHINRYPAPEVKLEATPVPAAKYQVAVALARLALGSGHIEIADQMVQEAIRLAPDAPEGHVVLASLRMRGRDAQGAFESADRALKAGSNDPDAFYIWAQEHVALNRRGIGNVTPQVARDAVNHYEEAINRFPLYRSAYGRMASLAGIMTVTGKTDVQFLALGRKLFPDDRGLEVGMAQLELKQGETDQAKGLLQDALQHGEDLPPGSVEVARAVLRGIGGASGLAPSALVSPLHRSATYRLGRPRYGATAVADEQAIYVVGGTDGKGELLGEIERLDLKTGEAAIVPGISVTPRRYAAAVLNGGKLFILGGQMSPGAADNSAFEVVDLASSKVSRGRPMPTLREQAAAVLVKDRIYLIGGTPKTAMSNARTGNVDIYDLATAKWSTAAAMPTARECRAVAMGDSILVAGGFGGSKPVATVESYDPGADAWTPLPPLCEPVSAHSCAALGGKLYLFGNYNAEGDVVCYDPASHESNLVQVGFTPARHTAAVAASGAIYVIGGMSQNRVRRDVQVFTESR